MSNKYTNFLKQHLSTEELAELKQDLYQDDIDPLIVTTASPLNGELKNWLIRTVNKSLGQIPIKYQLDPSLIGGAKVYWQGQEIDNSILSKLRN